MKLYKVLTVALLGGLLTTSCSDWFDVTSSNEIREDDHYSKDSGFKQTLVGCYLAMSEEALYGMNLSWYMPDLMANQTRSYANYSTSAAAGELQVHKYNTTYTKPLVESVWTSAYSVIVNANEALLKIDGRKDAMDDINYHVIKGELLAVRAMMHFQLLRLYGYGNWAERKAELDAKKTIPYVTTVNKNITEQATGAEMFAHLTSDLTNALDLLKDYDPVCGTHDAAFYANVNDDGFYSTRNNRLNYYAVKALLAQVYMWEGSSESLAKALPICEELIGKLADGVSIRFDNSNTFLLTLSTPGTLNKQNASLVNEALFAVSINNLDQKMSNYINPVYASTDYNAIYLTADQMTDIYGADDASLDVRATVLLSQNLNGDDQGYVPVKLYQKNLGTYYSGKVPVIRLPEIYYMAAECYAAKGNAQKALDLLNVVREKRGLYDALVLPDDASAQVPFAQQQIAAEYRKEFLGEGEIFYYYKRTGAEAIPNHENMTDADYLLPYPDMETSAGRVQ